MSDQQQPYGQQQYGESYEGYDPYQPQQQQQQYGGSQPYGGQQPQAQPQTPAWPGQQQPAYDDGQAQQYTQQWQGQTWETQMQAPVTAAPPAAVAEAPQAPYLPPQGTGADAAAPGTGPPRSRATPGSPMRSGPGWRDVRRSSSRECSRPRSPRCSGC